LNYGKALRKTNRLIHEKEIGGVIFYAYACNHFCIQILMDSPDSRGAEIGNAEINYMTEPSVRYGNRKYTGAGYYLSRYGDEIRSNLTGLNKESVEEFSKEFGLVIGDGMRRRRKFHEAFLASNCAKGFKSWINKHPKIAKSLECSNGGGLISVVRDTIEPLSDNEFTGR
jgi:hypothetical protein